MLPLGRWFSLFPRENFFITSLEQFKRDEVGVFEELLRFIHEGHCAGLTVDKDRLAAQLKVRYNQTRTKGVVDSELVRELGDFYAPYDEKLFSLLGQRLW